MTADLEQALHLFDSADFDWDHYLAYRPRYREELYEIILDHHKSHEGAGDAACDIGCGNGIVAMRLVQQFNHVLETDPSATHIASAISYKSRFPDLSHRIEAAVLPGEAALPVAPHSIDLITCAEAIHWTDPDKVIDNAAKALRPNGTLAIWLYGTRPFVASGHDRYKVEAALDRLHRQWFASLLAKNSLPMRPGHIMAARLTDITMSPEIWRSVRRVQWHSDEPMYGQVWPDTATYDNLSCNESIERREGSCLYEKIGIEWIVGYFRSLYPGLDSDSNCAVELSNLRAIISNKHDSITIAWPTCLLLATRNDLKPV